MSADWRGIRACTLRPPARHTRAHPPPHHRPQAFHALYHTDASVLLGAPTGSGKTISAELAMLRCFTAHPGQKARAWFGGERRVCGLRSNWGHRRPRRRRDGAQAHAHARSRARAPPPTHTHCALRSFTLRRSKRWCASV